MRLLLFALIAFACSTVEAGVYYRQRTYIQRPYYPVGYQLRAYSNYHYGFRAVGLNGMVYEQWQYGPYRGSRVRYPNVGVNYLLYGP